MVRSEFYINDTAGIRQYFKTIEQANAAAQAQANDTGKMVSRHDLNGGQSYFYPRGKASPMARKIGTGRTGFPPIEGTVKFS